jgi:hypothetical protein
MRRTNVPSQYSPNMKGFELNGVANKTAIRCAEGLTTKEQMIVAVKLTRIAMGLQNAQ